MVWIRGIGNAYDTARLCGAKVDKSRKILRKNYALRVFQVISVWTYILIYVIFRLIG